MTLLLTLGLFATCMTAMAVGVLLSDRALRGSCGGPEVHTADGDALSCGACPRKANDVCPSDDPLVAIAQLGNPKRTLHHP